MRLTKTMFIVEEKQGEFIGYDPLGRPKYSDPYINYHPIPCQIEPYSSELTRTRLGLFAEVTHRAFCRSNDKLNLNVPIHYDGEERYKVTEILKYDKHYEVMLKKD